MIKKLLFIAAIISTASITAQNLDLKDNFNNSIDGRTHYIYSIGPVLFETKFHVGNSSGAPIDFDCTVYEAANPTSTSWQVCFGTLCLSTTPGVTSGQNYAYATAPAGGTYDTLKVAPFSLGWSAGNFGVFRVTVYDNTNSSDSSSAYIYWAIAGKPSGDQNSNTVIDGSEIAGDIDENGIIDGAEITGDMNGDGMINVWEVNGDANGNGFLDIGEVTSVTEFTENNVSFSTYPNPATNNLNINYDIDGYTSNARVDVYDILGQKVNSFKLDKNKGQLKVNVENLNSGVYFYTIKVNEKTIRTERVIVK